MSATDWLLRGVDAFLAHLVSGAVLPPLGLFGSEYGKIAGYRQGSC
jgi:hypothetical protein